MTVRPPLIVAGWTMANLVLAAVLLGFGEIGFAVALYFAAAAPALVFAAATHWMSGRNPDPVERFALRPGSDWIPALAFGLALTGAGLIFGAALIVVGAAISAVSLTMLVRSSRGAR